MKALLRWCISSVYSIIVVATTTKASHLHLSWRHPNLLVDGAGKIDCTCLRDDGSSQENSIWHNLEVCHSLDEIEQDVHQSHEHERDQASQASLPAICTHLAYGLSQALVKASKVLVILQKKCAHYNAKKNVEQCHDIERDSPCTQCDCTYGSSKSKENHCEDGILEAHQVRLTFLWQRAIWHGRVWKGNHHPYCALTIATSGYWHAKRWPLEQNPVTPLLY